MRNGNGDASMKFHSEQGNFDPTFSYILPFNNRLGADNTYEMSVKMENQSTFVQKKVINKGLQQCTNLIKRFD